MYGLGNLMSLAMGFKEFLGTCWFLGCPVISSAWMLCTLCVPMLKSMAGDPWFLFSLANSAFPQFSLIMALEPLLPFFI